MSQEISKGVFAPEWLKRIVDQHSIQRILLVCGNSCGRLPVIREMEDVGTEMVRFSDFHPNPDVDSVKAGIETFQKKSCDAILAVGGGSCIDVAKCIRYFAGENPEPGFLHREPAKAEIPLMVIPATAGSGSEATQFAVIYEDGIKQSVDNADLLPDYVLLLPELLESLPLYQKKCTVLDALCHGVESCWAVGSTEESREFSEKAITKILGSVDSYLEGSREAASEMLEASHLSGKAINISRTTAGHAMCYGITKMFGIPHGHAAALCTEKLWHYMTGHLDDCCDSRGKEYLAEILRKLDHLFGEGQGRGAEAFSGILRKLELPGLLCADEEQIQKLSATVNIKRLRNHPVHLSDDAVRELYKQILQ